MKRYAIAEKANDIRGMEKYKWHKSRTLRRTANKFVDHLTYLILGAFLGLAITEPMGAAEYDAFIKEFKEYNKLVGKAIEDFAKKEVKIEFEPLTDEAFAKLMTSNEWTMDQVVALSEIICKNKKEKCYGIICRNRT